MQRLYPPFYDSEVVYYNIKDKGTYCHYYADVLSINTFDDGDNVLLNYNSGYSFDGMNPNLEIYDIKVTDDG